MALMEEIKCKIGGSVRYRHSGGPEKTIGPIEAEGSKGSRVADLRRAS